MWNRSPTDIARRHTLGVETVGLAAALIQVRSSCSEVEGLSPDVTDADGRHNHTKRRENLCCSRRSREGEDVLVPLQRAIVRQLREIARIGEKTVAVGLDKAGVVLADAFEAAAAR